MAAFKQMQQQAYQADWKTHFQSHLLGQEEHTDYENRHEFLRHRAKQEAGLK